MEENVNVEKSDTVVEAKQALPKKTIIIIVAAIAVLVAVVLIAIFAVGAKNDEDAAEDAAREERIRDVELGSAKSAYKYLNTAAGAADEIVVTIYNAWHFAIYRADDLSDYQKIRGLADALDVYDTDISEAMENLGLLDDYSYTVLEDFNYTVAVAKEVCRIKGLYDEAEKNINDALTLIQKISEKNREYTKHNELSNYYSFVLAYYNFAKSPTGSFNQLSNTIDNYQTQIITQKNKLSIYFE